MENGIGAGPFVDFESDPSTVQGGRNRGANDAWGWLVSERGKEEGALATGPTC